MDTMRPHFHHLPSVAVFGSQSKAAEDSYLRRIRDLLCQSEDLFPLTQAIQNLPTFWSSLVTQDPKLAALSHGPRSLRDLSDWISTGSSGEISTSSFGIVAIPLLTIIQLVQYHQFLQAKEITQAEFLAVISDGAGVQGYCSGLLPGTAVACFVNEVELVGNACKALRLAVGLGAYGDLGIEDLSASPTMRVVRLKHENQAEEIVQAFPQVIQAHPGIVLG